LALQNEGMQYLAEQQQLIQASNGAFFYSSREARSDSFTAQGLVQNLDGTWSPVIRSPYPDYLSVNINSYAISAGVSLNTHTLDLYGQWSLGHAYGNINPYSLDWGLSLTAGYIISPVYSSYITDNFLLGGGLASTVTVPTGFIPFTGATLGVNHSYGGLTAAEYGLSFPVTKPSATVSPAGYGFKIIER
jgi:hypothetical protein